MTKIVSDSQGNLYEYEVEHTKENKTEKKFLTLYKDDETDGHYVILYTFEGDVPIPIKNSDDDYATFIRHVVSSKSDNLFRIQYPPVVNAYLKKQGSDSNDVWGKTVYEVVNVKPYLLLTYISGNTFMDDSLTVSTEFLNESRIYGIDVTDIYADYKGN